MTSLGEILGLQSFQDRRAQGGPQDVANRRRKEQQENALTQLLNQQSVDQNSANLRGTQLQNTQTARDMARKPQNKFERIKGQDGYQYQVETGPNGQMVGAPTRMEGFGKAPTKNPINKIPTEAMRYMPPEVILNPDSVDKATFNRLATSAFQQSRANPQTTPLDEINLDLKRQEFREGEAKSVSAAQTQTKAEGLKGDVVRLAGELSKMSGLQRSVGSLQGSAAGQFLTGSDESADFINKHDHLKSILTAENLDLMSGVLSESDVKILSNIAGGGLQLNGSEAAYKKELSKLQGFGEVGAPVGEITTQAQYDQLPSGAEYTEDGVKMRKP